MAWYNDNDPRCAAWLRGLVRAEMLSLGEVDERDIRDLEPADCPDTAHFFAGIGGWPYALRLAGWSDAAPVWTGSCPCQPFSQAGRKRGAFDERHLWPVWRTLIAERLPPVVFGEQVGSPLGREWLAGVRADLEELGYAVGAADLCAASTGAPHIRQRLFFGAVRLGDYAGARWELSGQPSQAFPRPETILRSSGSGEAVRLGNPLGGRGGRNGGEVSRAQARGCREGEASRGIADGAEPPGEARRVVFSNGQRRSERRQASETVGHGNTLDSTGFWSNFDLVWCRDGAYRRVEPGSFPLAHGVPARVGRLRGYGNAIVAPLAAEFVQAFLETLIQINPPSFRT